MRELMYQPRTTKKTGWRQWGWKTWRSWTNSDSWIRQSGWRTHYGGKDPECRSDSLQIKSGIGPGRVMAHGSLIKESNPPLAPGRGLGRNWRQASPLRKYWALPSLKDEWQAHWHTHYYLGHQATGQKVIFHYFLLSSSKKPSIVNAW